MKKVKLSIIILNYNTKELTLNCIDSVIKNTSNLDYEIIVVDNGSTDGLIDSISKVRNTKSEIKIIANKENLGFAGGNNSARSIVSGEYVLFLNSDTLVPRNTLSEAVNYISSNPKIGALGCKTILPNGELDPDARRSFPTPWVALTHFSLLDRLFPKSKLFSKYWYGYKSANEISNVDVIQGAFFLTTKNVLGKVDWFDEDYFLDGEDIDLCWKIKEAGYEIVYYPKVSITHIKKASKDKVRKKFVSHGVRAMEIFYKKHLWSRYPVLLNYLVLIGIKTLKLLRSIF